jgi:signal transduction histidine kinase
MNSNSRMWRRPPAWAVDAVVAVVVAVAVLAGAVWTRPAGSSHGSGPLVASLLVVVSAAALLLRRRWPLPVLAVTVAVTIAWFALGYNVEDQYLRGHLVDLAFLVALYTVASGGDRRRNLLVGAVLVVVMAVSIVLVTGQGVGNVLVVAGIGWVLVPLLLGEVVRGRREYVVAVREQALREERLRIARELHDVMAHTISVIMVQAGVGADVLADAPGKAREALGTIRTASREAMAELRATVGVLRGADGQAAPRAPTPGLGQLNSLLEAARHGGLHVEAVVTGDPRPLPPAVDLTVYRILQESLTNVVRHAQGTTATVAIGCGPDDVVIKVCDDGRGAALSAPLGQGGES